MEIEIKRRLPEVKDPVVTELFAEMEAAGQLDIARFIKESNVPITVVNFPKTHDLDVRCFLVGITLAPDTSKLEETHDLWKVKFRNKTPESHPSNYILSVAKRNGNFDYLSDYNDTGILTGSIPVGLEHKFDTPVPMGSSLLISVGSGHTQFNRYDRKKAKNAWRVYPTDVHFVGFSHKVWSDLTEKGFKGNDFTIVRGFSNALSL